MRLKSLLAAYASQNNTLTLSSAPSTNGVNPPVQSSKSFKESVEKLHRRILELERQLRLSTTDLAEVHSLSDSLSLDLSTAKRKAEASEDARASILAEAEMGKADAIARSQAFQKLAAEQGELERQLNKVEANYEMGVAHLEAVKARSVAVAAELRVSTEANRKLTAELASKTEKAASLEAAVAKVQQSSKVLRGDLAVHKCEAEVSVSKSPLK